MRALTILLSLSLLAFSTVSAHARGCKNLTLTGIKVDDSRSVNFKNGTLVIEYEYGRPERVEITKEYELYVDNERVTLDAEQQKLVRDYYDLAVEIVDEAKKIGLEGAKIGISGAKIGMQAVAGVFRVLLTSYDSDDLEHDMEREAAKIEARAARLETRADLIEEMAKDLEDLYEEMEEAIPEMRG